MATANIKAVISAEDRASSTLKSFGTNVNDVAKKAALGLTVAGAALTYFAKESTDFTKDYLKSSRNIARETGVNITEASRLIYTTGRLGISTEETSQLFGIFSKQISGANENFNKYGISIKDSLGNQRSFTQILLDTADKFQKLPDGIEKTNLAMELFGRSGKDMLPVLNLGSQGIQNLQQQADKLGLTLNQNTIAQVTRLIQSQKNLKDSTDALKIAVGTATAPVLTAFNEKINQVLQKLLSADPATRNLTASILAFGGPVLSATGALIGLAANLTTIIMNMRTMRTTTDAATAATHRLRLAVLAPMIMPAIAIGAVLASLAAVIAKAIETKRVVDDANRKMRSNTEVTLSSIRSLQNQALLGNERAMRSLRAMGGSGRISGVPGVPQFASGTNFAPGGMALVGEQGPELVNLPRGSQVIPNNAIGGNLNININAGAFMGSQQDARKYAQMIFNAYNDLMSSRGMA